MENEKAAEALAAARRQQKEGLPLEAVEKWITVYGTDKPIKMAAEEKDTMFDMRSEILSYRGPNFPDFCFLLEGAPLPREQETTLRVWRILNSKRKVSLQFYPPADDGALDRKRAATSTALDDISSKRTCNRGPAIVPAFAAAALRGGQQEMGVNTLVQVPTAGSMACVDSRKVSAVTTGKESLVTGMTTTVGRVYAQETEKDAATETERKPIIGNATKVSQSMGASKCSSEEAKKRSTQEAANLVVENETHKKLDVASEQSLCQLDELLKLLNNPENERFCSEERRQEWCKEIIDLKNNTFSDVIIGCLGASGAGKSSLLNALLNESEILPTSCSRGCTAAVIELRFNIEFVSGTGTATVYRGEVEFISLREWRDELAVLLDLCSMNDNHEAQGQEVVWSRKPDEADGSEAWSKLNEVYGRGTMESYAGRPKEVAWNELSNHPKVLGVLGGQDETRANTIVVEEGTVDAIKAKTIYEQLPNLKGALKREKAKWAKAFRKKINDYVYRKGKANEPQTWPLIRKVTLFGPWAVLSSGACLVDLPGVRDANAARAKVAETYLQNCHKIWIVAPIKRAVDDKTAKDLLGEQFKRRLLMDGQYGMVSFICTHSDDCETTEIMRDHEDVVKAVQGRWEQMQELQSQIEAAEKQRNDLNDKEQEMKDDLEEANDEVKDLKREIKDCQEEEDDDGTGGSDSDNEDEEQAKELKKLKDQLATKNAAIQDLRAKLGQWNQTNSENAKKLNDQVQRLQKDLKAIASIVRNEYSKKCLQEDFKAGLEELTRKPDEEEMAMDADGDENKEENNALSPLPADFQLEVHCISSNDYMKIRGLKGGSDGQSLTFTNADDTQIPSLGAAVHATTLQYREGFVTSMVSTLANIVERIKLFAFEDNDEDLAGNQRRQQVFEKEIKTIELDMQPIIKEFYQTIEKKLDRALQPSLEAGAAKGGLAAMVTVSSWTDKNRRTRHDRGPNQNGLFWNTFETALKQDGVFTSVKAGRIDFNQELCDPVEKEYCREWQATMDSAITRLLEKTRSRVKDTCFKVIRALGEQLVDAGIDSSRVSAMESTAKGSYELLLNRKFKEMKKEHQNTQRELSRSLRSNISERMKPGYDKGWNVARGRGFFIRMKNAVEDHSKQVAQTMFNEAINELLDGVQKLTSAHKTSMQELVGDINKLLLDIYSVSWNDQSESRMNTKAKQEASACRNKMLRRLSGMSETSRKTMTLVGLQEELDYDVVGVDTWQDALDKKMEEAKATGNFVDLADSDDDDNDNEVELPSSETNIGRENKDGHFLPRKPKFQVGDNVKALHEGRWYLATIIKRFQEESGGVFSYLVYYPEDETTESEVPEKDIQFADSKRGVLARQHGLL